MLMELYDEQEVLRSYVESERYEAENAANIKTAKRFLDMGKFSIEEIAKGTGLTVEEVEELRKELLQTVQRSDYDIVSYYTMFLQNKFLLKIDFSFC